MRTQYVFEADTSDLVYICEHKNHRTVTVNHKVNHKDEFGEKVLTEMFVSEDETAEREFFNHFGDDSSWPAGWYAAVTESRFTKLRTKPMEFTKESWCKENYS